jgi:1-acyl-sn-glycerol-3-phosphate acyltransferase
MIRSLLFNFIYVSWTLAVGIVFLPAIFFPQHIILLIVGKIWAQGLYFFLKLFCNLRLELEGRKNIPNYPAIFASKHQSALETFMFHILINKPVFVLKKELLNIPVFGYYLKKMGMIAIDRDGGIKSIKLLLQQVQLKLSQGYSIVIFPEGTRTAPGESISYNPGITAIYNLKAAPVIPIALNTGCFWPKDSFTKKSGQFTIAFLSAMEDNLSKKDFIEQLQSKVDNKSNELFLSLITK